MTERLTKLKELAAAAAVAVESLVLAIDLPRRWSITVEDVKTGFLAPRSTKKRQRLAGAELGGKLRAQRSTRINLYVRDPVRGLADKCAIVIDLDRMRVDLRQSTEWLLGKGTVGSFELRTHLAMMPLTTLLRPLTGRIERRIAEREVEQGMSRHAASLLRELDGKLDLETMATLTKGLKNLWKYERKMAQRLTLGLARHKLSQCVLTETFVAEKDAREYGDVPSRSLVWVDADNDQIATGHLYGSIEYYIKVCGEEFTRREDVDALAECYADKVERNRYDEIPADADDAPANGFRQGGLVESGLADPGAEHAIAAKGPNPHDAG